MGRTHQSPSISWSVLVSNALGIKSNGAADWNISGNKSMTNFTKPSHRVARTVRQRMIFLFFLFSSLFFPTLSHTTEQCLRNTFETRAGENCSSIGSLKNSGTQSDERERRQRASRGQAVWRRGADEREVYVRPALWSASN